MQLSLAEQLRDLANDLELQARWTALSVSPAADHGQEHWEFSDPSFDAIGGLASNPRHGNESTTDDNRSSANRETVNAENVSVPISPSYHDAEVPVTYSSPRFRPPNPSEEYEMGTLEPEPGELEKTSGFNNPPSTSSSASRFSQSPGPDRQMSLFRPVRPRKTLPRKHSPAPSCAASSNVESDHDPSISLPPPPEKKKAWRETDVPKSDGSSAFERPISRTPLPIDASFTNKSEFNEGATEVLTTEYMSERTNEIYTSTEPSSFLIDGTKILGLEDPFRGKTPMEYPKLHDPDESAHNRLTEPINRSHKLFLDLQAARRDFPDPALPPPLPPRPSVTIDMMPVMEAAKMPLPPSPVGLRSTVNRSEGEKQRKPLDKPSMWTRLAKGVVRVVGHRIKKSPGKNDGKDADTTGGRLGRNLRLKHSPGDRDH